MKLFNTIFPKKIKELLDIEKNKDIKVTDTIVSAEVWMVYWTSIYGLYSTDRQEVCRAFTSKEDAELFIDKLEEACNLTKNNSTKRSIRLRKQ